MKRPFIMVAPNGARRSKADHPALPVTIAEIVETAQICYAAGARGLHLHIRDDQGAHSLDPGRYRETLSELATAVPKMMIQITTEAAGKFDVATQLACLQGVQPHHASIALREIARAPGLANRVYGLCSEIDCAVQHIIYDRSDIALMQDWRNRKILRPEQTDVLLVLGRYSENQTSSIFDIAPLLNAIPDGARWMLCAFGPQEHLCLAEAARLGGDLRVGFENSLIDPDGFGHKNNAASVAALINRIERKAA